MVRYAKDMLLRLDDGSSSSLWSTRITQSLLVHVVSPLDEWGAWEWDLRLASVVWCLLFAVIRSWQQPAPTQNKKKASHHINWYSLIHGAITGIGGATCAYLSFVSSEQISGLSGMQRTKEISFFYGLSYAIATIVLLTSNTAFTTTYLPTIIEPLGSLMCHGPLTSLHRVLPTAAMGYAVLDLIDGMRLGWDFLGHGAAMFAFSAYVMEVHHNEVLAVFLTMECSTIFLNLIHAPLPAPLALANMLVFTVSFFVCRLIFGPYAHYQYVTMLWGILETTTPRPSCLPRGFEYIIFATGWFFHVLNAFWFYKILQKLRRKLNRTEGVTEANQLVGSGNPNLWTTKSKVTKEQD